MHRFLIPDVLLRFGQTEIGGAFILDTLLNRNRTLGTITSALVYHSIVQIGAYFSLRVFHLLW